MVGKCSASQKSAETRDRTGDLQIFSLTLSQLSYRGSDEGHLALDKGNSWPIVFSTLPARGTSCSPRVCECVCVCVCACLHQPIVHVCVRGRGWRARPAKECTEFPCLQVHNWPRGVTVSTLDSESSDRGSNPREAFTVPTAMPSGEDRQGGKGKDRHGGQ